MIILVFLKIEFFVLLSKDFLLMIFQILTEWVTEKLSNEDIRLDDFLEKDLTILTEQLRPYDRWKMLAEELGKIELMILVKKFPCYFSYKKKKLLILFIFYENVYFLHF